MCVLLGLGAGYGLRSGSSGAGVSGSADGKESASSKNAQAASRPASQTAAGLSTPLKDLLKDLMGDYDQRSARKAFASLSAAEIQDALKQLAAMPKSVERDALRAELYRAWAAVNPQAAWQAALVDALDKTGSMLSAVAAAVAKANPNAAIDLAMSLGMGGKRGMVLSAVFSEWAKKDVLAAMEYSRAHPEVPVDTYAFTSGLTKLAETDPVKAANLAMGIKGEFGYNGALISLMNNWIESDPNAAFDWALKLENPKMREDAVSAAVSAWAKFDPKAAMAYVESIPDLGVRKSAYQKAWADWFRNEPLSATDYIATVKEPTLQNTGRFGIARFAESLGAKERGELLARLPEGELRNGVMDSLTGSLIGRGKFNDAMDILNDLPESRSRDRNVSKLGIEWAKQDPKAADAWLKQLPASSDRDLAVAGYVRILARSSPDQAIEWANQIPDAKLRSGALQNVAVGWMRSDPAAAEKWFTSLPGVRPQELEMLRRYAGYDHDEIGPILSVGQRH